MATKNVIIGGGTGFIGQYIKEALLKRGGVHITIISRNPGPGQISWKNVESYGLPKDTVGVINVAGQNILDPMRGWNNKFKKLVWDSRIETTKILTKAVLVSNAQSYVTISGVAYYPPDGGKTEYTEDNICEKYDFLSDLTHEWEAAAKLPERSKCRQVVIRSGVVLGKYGGMIQQILLPFRLGLGGPLGNGNQLLPWIHVKDLARLFIFAMNNNHVTGVLNGVAPQIITNKEFAQTFAKSINRSATIPLPAFVLKMIFGERAKIMLEGQRVLPQRTLKAGFVYRYDTIDKACTGIAKNLKDAGDFNDD